jgi:hypothetical protein
MVTERWPGAASAIYMRCALCGHPLCACGAPTVPTRDGGRVHIACAYRHALVAWSRRQRWALLHAAVVFSTVVLLWTAGGALWALVVGGGTHLLLHRRWWQHIVPLRRWHYLSGPRTRS